MAQESGRRSSRGVQFAEAGGLQGLLKGVDLDGGGGGSPTPAQAQPPKSAPLSEQLAQELARRSPQVDAQGLARIDEALRELLAACQGVAVQGGSSDAEVSATQLLPLGNYFLGVLGPGDEVDVLYLAPLSLKGLPEFCKLVQEQLLRRDDAKNGAGASADGLLSAPGFRIELQGVCLKVLVSRNIPNLPAPHVHSAVVSDMAGVYNRQAMEKILSSVPDFALFQALLRFVRIWAKQRGVHGAFLGFPGDVAWAVCCARVCMSYPNLELSQVAGRFFRTLSRWDWRQPVSLDAPFAPPSRQGGAAPVPEQAGPPPIMEVLIPVGSGFSATTTMTAATMKITAKELRRGYKLLQQVEVGRTPWMDVYKDAKFFTRHRHYLEIDVLAQSEAIFAAWAQWVEQQLQDLGPLFEPPQMANSIVTLRPWPEWVDFKDPDWRHARAILLGLHLDRGPVDAETGGPARSSFDLREPIVKFLEKISQWPLADQYAKEFELIIKHVRVADLEAWVAKGCQGPSSGTGILGGGAGGLQTNDEDDGRMRSCSV